MFLSCLRVESEAPQALHELRVVAKKKSIGYASEDDTRPSKPPDSELRNVIAAVQQYEGTAMKSGVKVLPQSAQVGFCK